MTGFQTCALPICTCWFHTFELNINGTNTLGFCADHTKQMKTAYIGQEWKNPEPVDRNAHPVMCAFLDLFYDRYQTSVQIDKDYPDESEAQKLEREPYYYDQYARDFYNATYQAIVWMELGGAFAGYDITDPDDRAQIEKMVAKEMGRVASRLDSSKTEQGWVDHYAEKTVKWILAAYFKETIDGQTAHKSPELDYYIYHHSDSSKQPILTAIPPERDEVDGQEAYITLDKVDENGNTLSGASFEVYLDSSCTQKVSEKGFMTGATQGQAYGPFGWLGTETIKTLYLKETKAPSGHTLGAMEGRILSVVVDSTINDEKIGRAHV